MSSPVPFINDPPPPTLVIPKKMTEGNRRRRNSTSNRSPSPLRELVESEKSEDEAVLLAKNNRRSSTVIPPEILDPLSAKLHQMKSVKSQASNESGANFIAGIDAAPTIMLPSSVSGGARSPDPPVKIKTPPAVTLKTAFQAIAEAADKMLNPVGRNILSNAQNIEDDGGIPGDGDTVDGDGNESDGADGAASHISGDDDSFGKRIKTRIKGKLVTDFEYLERVQHLGYLPSLPSGAQVTTYSVPTPLHRSGLSGSHSAVPRVLREELKVTDSQTTHSSADERENAINPSKSGIRGPVWTMKFTHDGKHMAAAGEDAIIRVWSLLPDAGKNAGVTSSSSFSGQQYVSKQHNRVGSDTLSVKSGSEHSTPVTRSKSSAGYFKESSLRSSSSGSLDTFSSLIRGSGMGQESLESVRTTPKVQPVFRSRPLRIYTGHTGPVLDLAFSKNNFLISASMDKMVRLWHLTQKECLCVFEHPDSVTSVQFHPTDDELFLSGCLDARIRIWTILHKKVKFWNEISGNPITAVSFAREGSIAIAGTVSGDCVFYESNELKYNTQIQVRSTRGLNSKGSKITGIQAFNNTKSPEHEKILVTSNDSRVRIYFTRDKSLFRKYRGFDVRGSQIRASVSSDGKYIISGSEDHFAYIWNTEDQIQEKKKLVKASHDLGLEKFYASSGAITCAVFCPVQIPFKTEYPSSNMGCLIVTSDIHGRINVYQNVSPGESTRTSTHGTVNGEIIKPSVDSYVPDVDLSNLPPMKSMRPIRPSSIISEAFSVVSDDLDTSSNPPSPVSLYTPRNYMDILPEDHSKEALSRIAPGTPIYRRKNSTAYSLNSTEIGFRPRTLPKTGRT